MKYNYRGEYMSVISTKKDVAEKVFKIQYLTLWRWCRDGVPKVRRQKVDRILCDLEDKILSAMAREPNVENRLYGLSDPASFKRRLGRLFPVFSEE